MRQFLLLCLLGAFVAFSFFPASSRSDEDADDTDLPNSSPPKVDSGVGSDKTTKTDDQVAAREGASIKLDGLSPEESKLLREQAEKFEFQSDVTRMMKLIINSLYKNKEIFLRELISNASDALDKIRFYSLTDKSVLGSTTDLTIKIHADKENRVLHITDTGVGMTKQDLIKNLGTIAKSGTSEFLNSVATGGADTSNLIGQFGVGFYSAFLVADLVVVTSKHNDDKQHIWESNSVEFSVTEDPREDNQLGRGTRVSLYLKDEAQDYLETDKLRDLIKKYSEFINFDIYLYTSKTVEVEEEVDEDDEEEETPDAEKKDEDEAKVEDESEEEKKPKEKKKVEKTVWEWEIINANKPIWTRASKDVTDAEYVKFYEAFTKDSKEPLAHMHFTAEGEVAFRSILYIPSEAPYNFFSEYGKVANNLKLYVRRVFITDEFDDMLPKYLSFIRGVVDSDDLPLNVSRETLQQHKLLKVIKKKLVRKALEMLKKMSTEQYAKFWKQFGTAIKLGIMEDYSNRSRISKLLRFQSSNAKEGHTSLEDYVERMKKDQPNIYFVAGQSRSEVENSPFVENLLKRGYEVLYLIEPVDEYTIQNLPEFDGKKFQNVAKEGFKFGEETEKQKARKEALEKEYEPLTKWLAETLKDSVEKAVISERLAESPCALIANQYGWDGNMERIMKAQAYAKADDTNTEHYATQKKIMEINPRHPLIKKLYAKVSAGETDDTTADLAKVLLDTARLRSGYLLHDSVTFAQRIEKMLRLSTGVSLDEKVDEEEIIEEEPEPVKAETTEEDDEEDSSSSKASHDEEEL